MALVLNDRVKETSTTTGTGTLTLDGAVQGFETFSSAIGNSNTTFYAIELPGTTEFEVGRGTISAGQLARTEIISSSNSDSAVDFSAGTKIVFCTLPASKFVPGKFEGTNFTGSILIGHSTTGTLSSATNNTAVGIDALDAITSGNNNVAIGHNAFGQTTTAMQGVAVGVDAGSQNQGTDNVLVGFRAGQQASSTKNVGIGKEALRRVTGTRNIGLGFEAGDNITSGAGNVIIGGVEADSATADRQLKISGNDGSSTTTWISGDSAGALTFADKVVLAANKTIEFGDSGETISGDGTDLTITSSNDLDLVSNGTGTQSTLITSAGGIYLDSAETNRIDAATGILNFYKAGTLGISLNIDGNNDTVLHSRHNDKDIKFDGQDNNSTITALTLDMSAAGAATFNDKIVLGANKTIEFGDSGETISGDGSNLTIASSSVLTLDAAGDIQLDAGGADIEFLDDGTSFLKISNSSSDVHIRSIVQDKDILLRGNDGGSQITALTLDMSEAGDATFNSNIFLGDSKKANFGAGNDLQIYHDSSDSFIDDAGTGDLKIRSSFTRIIDISNDNVAATFASGGVNLRHSNAVKFTTTSTGATVTGALDVTAAPSIGNDEASFGFNAPNAELKAKNSSGSPAANFDIHTTNSSGTTARVLRATHDGILQLMSGDTVVGKLSNSSSDFVIESDVQDKDIIFKGDDGGSGITALTLDMSEAGAATFNSTVTGTGGTFGDISISSSTISDSGSMNITSGSSLTIDVDGSIILDAGSGGNGVRIKDDGTELLRIHNSSNDVSIETKVQDKDLFIKGNDGGSTITALTFDMSAAGAAAFNSTITADSGKDVILGKNQGTDFSNSLLVGHNTTGTLSSAQNNTGVGISALDALTSGDSNTAIGTSAGSSINTGSLNVFIGTSAGAGATDMQGCIAIGASALGSADPGNNNIAIGESAGSNITGVRNLCIGENAGDNITSGSGNVIIGSAVDPASATGNRQLIIAGNDGSTTTTFITGDSSGNITIPGTVTANGEVLSAGVSAGFAVAMAIAL